MTLDDKEPSDQPRDGREPDDRALRAQGAPDPLHVAIIMDGNGRWAQRRGMPRTAGHRAGVETVQRVVEAAPALGVTTLTLFAFSSDNWRRPDFEVNALMALLRHYLRTQLRRLADGGARLRMIGRRDRLPAGLADEIARAEEMCANGTKLDLQVAVDYSARDAIAQAAIAAAAQCPPGEAPSRIAFGRMLAAQNRGPGLDVDLLIRSGGEKRLSDFLLWEAAYAELCFTDVLWPDFTADDLHAAVADFHRRERRFGGVKVADLAAAE
jgi:undecaprenyl diphosphate synthase